MVDAALVLVLVAPVLAVTVLTHQKSSHLAEPK